MRNNHAPLGPVSVVLLIAASVGGYVTAHFRPFHPPVSLSTSEHIIDETEPLCRALTPTRNTLHFKVQPAPAFHRAGQARNLWTVECLDNKGDEIVHILWNEEARRCISITPIATPKIRKIAPLAATVDGKAAEATARIWVTRLNIAEPEAVEKSRITVTRSKDTWHVQFRLPNRIAMVWISAQSGEMMNAFVHDLPVTHAMQASSEEVSEPVPSA